MSFQRKVSLIIGRFSLLRVVYFHRFTNSSGAASAFVYNHRTVAPLVLLKRPKRKLKKLADGRKEAIKESISVFERGSIMGFTQSVSLCNSQEKDKETRERARERQVGHY